MRKFLVALACMVVTACSGADAPAIQPTNAPAAAPPAAEPAGAAAAATTTAKTDLFVRTFGTPGQPAIIFLHGGPGASSSGFEASVGQLFADKGFFVVAYDQRGGTRSPLQKTAAGYSFKTSSDDLATLIASLDIKNPVLLANSFGGSVALKFMESHPGVAKSTVLIDSPMNWPRTHLTCIQQSREVYLKRFDIPAARDMDALETRMFPHELTGPFTFPVEDVETVIKALNETLLFYPNAPSLDGLKMYAQFALAPENLTKIDPNVMRGYYANDDVGHTDFTPLLQSLSPNVFGIYGTDDRIFDETQLGSIRAAMTDDHFTALPRAGHFPFIDQPPAFVDAVVAHIAKMH